MKSIQPSQTWLDPLKQHVESKPIVIIRLNESDSAGLRYAKLGFNEFTIARPHELFAGIRTPAVCLLFETPFGFGSPSYETAQAFIGIISSCGAITTLDTRIKVKRAVRIQPGNEQKLLQLLTPGSHATQLHKKLAQQEQILRLSPKLSGELVKTLSRDPSNHGPMRIVAESLVAPRRYEDFSAVQEDAVQSALKAFGLGGNDRADELELIQGRATALARISTKEDAITESPIPSNSVKMLMVPARVPLIEDTVIERDARSVPGYKFTSGDLTGRALFKKGEERLEVFTANRRDLEHVFGVDLIYLNLSKKSLIMVQYKMLEPDRHDGHATDWIYRPEKTMEREMARMEAFARQHEAGPSEYRLNPQVFYLKFVKRDGALSNGGIVTTIDHYRKLLDDPICKGPRGAVRISYDALGGRYLRQGPFLDLIQSGYIGAYATTTEHLQSLIDAVLHGNRAVIAAVQSSTKGA